MSRKTKGNLFQEIENKSIKTKTLFKEMEIESSKRKTFSKKNRVKVLKGKLSPENGEPFPGNGE